MVVRVVSQLKRWERKRFGLSRAGNSAPRTYVSQTKEVTNVMNRAKIQNPTNLAFGSREV